MGPEGSALPAGGRRLRAIEPVLLRLPAGGRDAAGRPVRPQYRPHRAPARRKGSRLSRSCQQGSRPDSQGRGPGEEEKEDRLRQEEDPVQPPLCQRCRDLRTQEGSQLQLLNVTSVQPLYSVACPAHLVTPCRTPAGK